MYRAEVKYSEVPKFLTDKTISSSVHNLGKCIEINYSKVEELVKNVEKYN